MTKILAEVADISITQGHRGEERQNALYPRFTKLRWPHGKHNKLPSEAVDFVPYPRPSRTQTLWAALAYVAGNAVQIGRQRGLDVRWGGDWNQNGDVTDQDFYDLFHLEVRRAEDYIPLDDTDIAWLQSYGVAQN